MSDVGQRLHDNGKKTTTARRMEISDELNKFHFEKREKDDSKKPYRLQGSEGFENSPVRKRRSEISKSMKLRSVAMQFWTTAGLATDATMPKETYVFIHRRISRALAPELSEAEAIEAAEEDWHDDVKNAPGLDLHFEQ